MLFVLVAFFWAIASSHCELEVLPAFEIIACNDESESPSHSEAGAHCRDEACKTVEQGFYFHKQANFSAAKIVSILPFVLVTTVKDSLKGIARTFIDTSPQAPPSRHFVDRTALPVRAPSFVG